MRHRMVGREDGEAHRLCGFIGGVGKTDGIVIAAGNTDKQQKFARLPTIFTASLHNAVGRSPGGTDETTKQSRAAGNAVMLVGGMTVRQNLLRLIEILVAFFLGSSRTAR